MTLIPSSTQCSFASRGAQADHQHVSLGAPCPSPSALVLAFTLTHSTFVYTCSHHHIVLHYFSPRPVRSPGLLIAHAARTPDRYKPVADLPPMQPQAHPPRLIYAGVHVLLNTGHTRSHCARPIAAASLALIRPLQARGHHRAPARGPVSLALPIHPLVWLACNMHPSTLSPPLHPLPVAVWHCTPRPLYTSTFSPTHMNSLSSLAYLVPTPACHRRAAQCTAPLPRAHCADPRHLHPPPHTLLPHAPSPRPALLLLTVQPDPGWTHTPPPSHSCTVPARLVRTHGSSGHCLLFPSVVHTLRVCSPAHRRAFAVDLCAPEEEGRGSLFNPHQPTTTFTFFVLHDRHHPTRPQSTRGKTPAPPRNRPAPAPGRARAPNLETPAHTAECTFWRRQGCFTSLYILWDTVIARPALLTIALPRRGGGGPRSLKRARNARHLAHLKLWTHEAHTCPPTHDSPRILQAAAAWAWGTSYDIPMHLLPCSDCPHTPGQAGIALPAAGGCPFLRRFLPRHANCTGNSTCMACQAHNRPDRHRRTTAPIPEFPARTVTSSHVGLGNVVMHRHAPPPPVKAIVRVLPSVELPYPPPARAWCPAVMCTFARLNTHVCTPWGP
ncbi:hypothetical protein B0H14DRAFT_3882320 [Mycena olivaceomarginata]|nr:hypothetical protein B0H14DRAFT_3882320 [Mycena olivaceomarginata]